MDKNSQEIDAIIRLHNGKYGLVEIILGAHMADDAAKNLLRFAEKIDTKHAPAPRANSFEGIQSTEEMPLLTDIARTPQIVHPTSYLVHRQTPSAPAPSFLMVLTGVGTYAYRRDDGVLVVPLSTLRP